MSTSFNFSYLLFEDINSAKRKSQLSVYDSVQNLCRVFFTIRDALVKSLTSFELDWKLDGKGARILLVTSIHVIFFNLTCVYQCNLKFKIL